ncbi:MAG: PQQ-binding-like beta-propeller repeat protein [Gammaproteobacteria bacterium]|nr:PQQ-binding-like beta-propeller repeat protein [Gammaproteobacteria bacterium]
MTSPAIAIMLATSLLPLGGCEPSGPPTAEPPRVESASSPDPNNTAQSNLQLVQARQAMPGRPIYEAACASCHEGAVRKAPHRDMIGLMPPEAILRSMEEGVMQEEASGLTPEERVLVAEFLAGATMGTIAASDLPACADDVPPPDFSTAPDVINWGLEPTNSRHIPAAAAGISAQQLPALKPRLAVRFPSANRARSQPTFAGGAILVGSHSGKVYALDQESGCAHWSYQASSEVRTGIVIGRLSADGRAATTAAFFGDLLGHVYAVNAGTGEELWRQRADDHPNATITGTPSLHDGVLYAPVSSLEVNLALDPHYECCTFRGSVAAYAADTGKLLWQTFTIEEPATVQYQNRAETDMLGPSGAVIWNSPAIDAKRNQLYVATGENMSSPATLTSDAIFAMDLDDGTVNWVFQATANDVWNVACDTENDHSCPPEGGPDFDFGAATMLLTASDGREFVVGGQKSGIVHAVNPDDGSVVWQTRVGRGGIQGGVHFGMAAAGDRLFVPISDMADGREYPDPARPGLHALDIRTGDILWSALNPDACNGRDFCHPGISQAVTAAGGVVYAGAMDGVLRVHDMETGAVLWEIDTTEEFTTITGETTHGGSFGGAAGPIIHNGDLALSSGYGIYNHMAGNLLLVLSASEPAPPEG